MNEKGWIKVHRQIQKNFLYPKKREFSRYEAWIDLLLAANYSDSELSIGNKKIPVREGELITSIRNLAFRWHWSKDKVWRFMNLLKRESQIETYERDNLRHIFICNYAHYQGGRDKSATESATANDEKPRQVNDCKSDECKDECDTGNPESATASATYIKEEVKEIYIPDFEKYQWDGMPSNQMEAIRGLCRHISGELPDLLTWRKPLTIHELIRLCEKYTLSRVSDKLEEMANNKGAEKRYSSVYLTCNNWLKRPPK